jgi:mitogen-activated protein kinase kinase
MSYPPVMRPPSSNRPGASRLKLTIPTSNQSSSSMPPGAPSLSTTSGGSMSGGSDLSSSDHSNISHSSLFSAEILAAVGGGHDGVNQYYNAFEPNISLGSETLGDVESLDEEGWRKVARAGDIVELGKLGEGFGGSVSRCKLRHGNTVFALKEITANPNPELQKQILRELQFNRSCNSPHIVKYYGTFLGEGSTNIFIAMEYCGGGSLEAIYKRVRARGGRIGEKVLGKVAEGVLSGLSYLHERHIIHRDIKPQNILLDINGQVKLCDFGVSGEVVNSLATTFTGTSYYMAVSILFFYSCQLSILSCHVFTNVSVFLLSLSEYRVNHRR